MHDVIGRVVRSSTAVALGKVVMGLKKLTAGDGYTYLTRQVAAHDSTEKGHGSLGDYYDEKGELPGQWLGAGLAGLDMQPGEPVTAEQMKSLFGLGEHPNADQLQLAAAAGGGTATQVEAAGTLGRRFPVFRAASKFNAEVAAAFTAYNRSLGRRWNAEIPPEERARIRTETAVRMFRDRHGREPTDARELDGFVARSSRQATSAVAGYDLTFSPVKSVSALWALAPREVATQIRAAHDAAVEDTLSWIEREVAYTRLGPAGVRQVQVRGLIAAAFTHRDSRAGDPDLHTHVAVSNKVQTEDGRWLALDGRLMYAAKVAASERYNTRLEAELIDRLGAEFVERERPLDKRPVREIRGVSSALTRWWSRRRLDIETRRAELATAFQDRHGRPPTTVEAIPLADQAALETRDAKHAPRSEAEQRQTWRREAETVMGGQAETDEMVARALARAPKSRRPTKDWVEETAAATITAIERSRATWQVWHVRAEAERQTRSASIRPDQLEEAVTHVTDAALSRCVRLGAPDPINEPAPLRRHNGESAYEVHGATRYTSAGVLAAEQELLRIARQTGSRALSDVRVEIACAESAARGIELNDAQAAMVRDLATSGAAVQLALAPAGTGKTTTMSVLSEAWSTADGQVIGLAPSAQAAHELGHAIRGHTDTLAKLTWTLAHEQPDRWPGWVKEIGPATMVIIDEAGQASTTELTAAARYITGRGGVVRLVGDDQQLASVGAGGILRDLQHEQGASTLSEVRRFRDPAEAGATLAVREGDAGSIGFYADNGRIHVGDIGATTDQAYGAWAADRDAGRDSVLLAPTRELVTRLNARARADRLSGLPQTECGPQVRLADGNRASTGDLIVTRRNARRLTISRSNWVKNGDRWVVDRVLPGGRLLARHLELDRTVELPADYVSEHVRLGYASTVHGAQGMTTDTAHVVATGEETRQVLYVALSRGREANHVYLATGHDGDPHRLIDQETLLPPTAIDVLTTILERDGSQRSARTIQRETEDPASQLHDAVIRYHDALRFAAEQRLGSGLQTSTDAQADALWPGITAEPAYPTLRAHLALHALEGQDPIGLLLDAAASRELNTSEDRAAALDWRIGTEHPDGPLPWLDKIPAELAHDPDWRPYLAGRAARVSTLADLVRDRARSWTPTQTPGWATALTAASEAPLREDLAVWRAAFAIPDEDSRPTGPPQAGSAAAAHQRALARRFRAVAGVRRADPDLLDRLPAEVRNDPHFGRLAERIAALGAANVDVQALLDKVLTNSSPLPDERTADALWWRLVRHLGPAALRATARTNPSLRPSWSTYLCERLDRTTAERVMADSMWPALVAAVHARPTEWPAEQLIDAAMSGRGPEIRAEDLCPALVWRIATMTDPPSDDEPEPPEPVSTQIETGPPRSANQAVSTPRTSTSGERIIELNEMALEHFAQLYPRSWAPNYLRERLGTDMTDQSRFTIGYASSGPASLIQHLTVLGATTDEMVDAGLARVTDQGHQIDAFRDRLMFPIYSDQRLVGFIGRRNPTKDDVPYGGPKYLNTRGTVVFTKGDLLFGLSEASDDLDAGATPVLVEGPLDAIAVTAASRGHAIGIAPLGTAFTDSQAIRLRPYFSGDRERIVIATDADAAGWQSAQRAFWRLAALGADPQHLVIPEGLDPADLLRSEGATFLAQRLSEPESLGASLVDHAITNHEEELTDNAARIWLARDLARVIGALPPEQWPDHTDHVTSRLGLPAGLLQMEVIDAGEAWTDDPDACARRALIATRSAAGTSRPRPRPTQRRNVLSLTIGLHSPDAVSRQRPSSGTPRARR